MNLKVKLLHPDAKIPTKAYPFDAGWDIYANEDVNIRPGETVKISTGIAISPPEKYNVTLGWDRSSLGSKGIHKLAGCIDSSYTGEIFICLTNLNIYPVLSSLLENEILDDLCSCKSNLKKAIEKNTYKIKKGEKIVQLLIVNFVPCDLEVVDDLTVTERGSKGFGSSN